MGSAQSQSSRKPRGSIAHPAVSPTLKIGTISILKVMTDVLGRLQHADTGLGVAKGERRFCRVPAVADQHPDRSANGESRRGPKGQPPTKAGKEKAKGRSHGVFPER